MNMTDQKAKCPPAQNTDQLCRFVANACTILSPLRQSSEDLWNSRSISQFPSWVI